MYSWCDHGTNSYVIFNLGCKTGITHVYSIVLQPAMQPRFAINENTRCQDFTRDHDTWFFAYHWKRCDKKKSRPLFAADETMWLLTYYKQQNEWTKQSFAFYIDWFARGCHKKNFRPGLFDLTPKIGWVMAKHKKGIWGAGTDMSRYLDSC